jgi:hypothetical protein
MMILKGKNGEQHKIFRWDLHDMYKGNDWDPDSEAIITMEDDMPKCLEESRPGNSIIRFNVNTHFSRLIFIIQTTKSNVSTARAIFQDCRKIEEGENNETTLKNTEKLADKT